MPRTFNLSHIDTKELRLKGELPAVELDIETADEVIHPASPLKYNLEVQKLDDSILVRGDARLSLDCDCVRCLKLFRHELELKDWAALLPLSGEDRIVVANDSVDLTPYLREDIVLAFPQHPLCKPDCDGLPKTNIGKAKKPASPASQEEDRWAALNKLKL